jgi:hypothetical protein
VRSPLPVNIAQIIRNTGLRSGPLVWGGVWVEVGVGVVGPERGVLGAMLVKLMEFGFGGVRV